MHAVRNRNLTSLVLALVGLAFFSGTLPAQSVNIEAAKKEGKVVLYGAVPSKPMDAINKPFEKKYGIKVDYWRAPSNRVMDRVLTEWHAGRPGFDVIEGTRPVGLLMKNEGLFTKYVPPSSQKLPDQFKEKDAMITPWRVGPLGILFNTDLVKGPDIPKRFEDLLDPKWKKKISIPDPSRHTSTAQLLRNLEKIMGPQWLEFVRALSKQVPHLVESFAPVPDVIVRGEAYLGIAHVKHVKQYKGPLDYVMLDKFLGDAHVLGLSAKGPNPNAGRLYMEYLMSLEGQKAAAGEGEFVLYPGVNPDIRAAEKVVARTIFMDSPTEEELKKLRVEFREIFFGK
ncbi:MAG: extracellular solute-binding protein [Deltaproteobacteria bacterium]|nr:extracellular solute-binding protein [Deltaproteobacteria bacterium]